MTQLDVWFKLKKRDLPYSEDAIKRDLKPDIESLSEVECLRNNFSERYPSGYIGKQQVCRARVYISDATKTVKLLKKQGHKPFFVW